MATTGRSTKGSTKKPATKAARRRKSDASGGIPAGMNKQVNDFIEKPTAEGGLAFKDRVLIAVKDGNPRRVGELFRKLADWIPVELVADAGSKKSTRAGKRAILDQTLKVLDDAGLVDQDPMPGDSRDDIKVALTLPKADSRFHIDPEFQQLLPPLNPGQEAALERSILLEGCREPLTLWNDGKTTWLVDGHNRERIRARHGLKPLEIRKIDLPDRNAALDWIRSQNVARRNLPKLAETDYLGRLFNAVKKHGGDRSGKGKTDGAVPPTTAKALADEWKVNRPAVIRAGELAEAIDVLVEAAGDNGNELRQKILAQELRLTKKAILELAEKPEKELARVVKQLLAGKARRRSKPSKRTTLKLSQGEPPAQAAALKDFLGDAELKKLHEEIGKLLPKNSSNDVADKGAE